MKVSIVTACWNSAATLRDTMRSVISQSYNDIEHIIMDGASKDGSVEIIKELEPLYTGGKTLRWVSKRDGGIYDAMNQGIDLATGDVVGILNSDDFFSADDVIERVVEAMDDETDAVYGDIHFVDPKDLSRCVRYYSSASFTPKRMLMGYQPAHPSFYCRREAYERYGKFDTQFKIAADFENMLRLIYVNGIRTKYMPMDFVTMRTGGASTSGFASHKQILFDHLKAYRKNGVRSNVFLDSSRYFFKLLDVVKARTAPKPR